MCAPGRGDLSPFCTAFLAAVEKIDLSLRELSAIISAESSSSQEASLKSTTNANFVLNPKTRTDSDGFLISVFDAPRDNPFAREKGPN